ncbi:hypothetical protein RCH33_3195 [Flavobacterium daejeonense]|nr:hypothetical protein RCH33_3195 [Flavobacterium daejeonense]
MKVKPLESFIYFKEDEFESITIYNYGINIVIKMDGNLVVKNEGIII